MYARTLKRLFFSYTREDFIGIIVMQMKYRYLLKDRMNLFILSYRYDSFEIHVTCFCKFDGLVIVQLTRWFA